MLRTSCAAALAAVVVGLAGCSPGAEPTPTSAGPLDAYFAHVQATDHDSMLARERTIQQLIAQCMTEQGFEYEPQQPQIQDDDGEQPGTRDYAQKYGYGRFSTPVSPQREPADEPDPYIESLSPGEHAAYMEAMFGSNPSGSWDDPEDIPFDEMGCHGNWLRYTTTGAGQTDPVYVAAAEQLRLIETSLLPNDPRVLEADAEWAACMSKAGWPGLRTQRDAVESVFAWGEGALDTETHVPVPHGESTVTGEKALALADWDCAVSTRYHQIRAEVRDELQQEYVDAHRDELEGWLATWGQ